MVSKGHSKWRRVSPIWIALAVTAAVWGCGMGSESLDSLDPGAVPATPSYVADIEPMLSLRCTHCHSADARPWSRAEPYLDTQGGAETWSCLIWQVIDEGRMPPGALDRPTGQELLALRRWASQRGCPAP